MQSNSKTCEHKRYRCFEKSVNGFTFCADHLKENFKPLPPGYKACEYISNKNELACTNIRRIDQLDENGFCDQHFCYLKRLKNDFEQHRKLVDPGLRKDQKTLTEDEEDEIVDVDGDWSYTVDSIYCDGHVEDDDADLLKNASVFTHKEILKRQIAALEREKQALLDYHSLIAEQLRRLSLQRAKQLKATKKKKKVLPLSAYENEENKYIRAKNIALSKYGSYINWKSVQNFLEKCDAKKLLANPFESAKTCMKQEVEQRVLERRAGYCSHFDTVKVKKPVPSIIKKGDKPNGFITTEPELCLSNALSILQPNESISNETQIRGLVSELVEEVARHVEVPNNEFVDVNEQHFCPYMVLPFADFCAGHILEDLKQNIYAKCEKKDCSQIVFAYERTCDEHTIATIPMSRDRRKANLSVDSLSNVSQISDLRPRSNTDLQLQHPSTSTSFGYPSSGEHKGIMRRGRPPATKMLPFLPNQGQIFGTPTVYTQPSHELTPASTIQTQLLSPKIVSVKKQKQPRHNSSSCEEDNGLPNRRVVIDSDEDEQELKKRRLDSSTSTLDQSIDTVASSQQPSFSQSIISAEPKHRDRRFKQPWKNNIQSTPLNPQFRNTVSLQGQHLGQQKGGLVIKQHSGRTLNQQQHANKGTDDSCARVQPFYGKRERKDSGTLPRNADVGAYDRIQNAGLEKPEYSYSQPSNAIRLTPVSQMQSVRHTLPPIASVVQGRTRLALSHTGTNLSNVPQNLQPQKLTDQHSTLISEQQHNQSPILLSQSNSVISSQTHFPAEHDYTTFRQPQARIRQPSIRRVQYLPVAADLQPRIPTGAYYRQRYQHPRARVITIPNQGQFNTRSPRSIGPRMISVQPVYSTVGAPTGVLQPVSSGTSVGVIPNQTGAPIYVNGGKHIYLKGIDIGSIQNVHAARYAPTNIVTKRRVIADGVIGQQHSLKQPRKQQFQTTGNPGTYNHYSRTLDSISAYPNHTNSDNYEQSIEHLSQANNMNPQTPHQPIVETKSPPVGLTPQQILAHDHDFSFSKIPPKEHHSTPNGTNPQTNNALEMLADVSVLQGRRSSASCGLEDEADD